MSEIGREDPGPETAAAARVPEALRPEEEPAEGEMPILRRVPDLGGLAVEDASGLTVGALFGALAEAENGLIRYVDVDLKTLDRHVLVPIGHARISEGESGPRVQLRAALLEQLEAIPPFPAEVDHIDDPFERALLEAYGRTFHGERYYAHPAYDHQGIYVGEHPVIGDDEGAEPVLTRLSYLPGWRVAKGEPDIRGWPLVLDDHGARLEVRDLIVDPTAEKVRYVVLAGPRGETTRLLPIGYLSVRAEAREVRAEGLTREDLAELPAYDGGGVTREHEERLRAALRRRLQGRRRYLLPDFRGGSDS